MDACDEGVTGRNLNNERMVGRTIGERGVNNSKGTNKLREQKKEKEIVQRKL